MQNKDSVCMDCNGIGFFDVEEATLSKPYIRNNRITQDILGEDKWQKIDCHCVFKDDECQKITTEIAKID